MTANVLLVEGKDDRRFFESLMSHLKIGNVEIEQIEGNVGKLRTAVPRIRQWIDKGRPVAIILDMDQLQMDHYRKMEEFISEFALSIWGWFLMPDNRQE